MQHVQSRNACPPKAPAPQTQCMDPKSNEEIKGMDIRWDFSQNFSRTKSASLASPAFKIGNFSFSIKFCTADVQQADVDLYVLCGHLGNSNGNDDKNKCPVLPGNAAVRGQGQGRTPQADVTLHIKLVAVGAPGKSTCHTDSRMQRRERSTVVPFDN